MEASLAACSSRHAPQAWEEYIPLRRDGLHIEAAISRDATDALVVGKVPGSECDDSKSGCSCVSWTTGLPLAVGYCRQQRIHGSGLATGDRRELLSYSMTTFPHTTLCICTSAYARHPPTCMIPTRCLALVGPRSSTFGAAATPLIHPGICHP